MQGDFEKAGFDRLLVQSYIMIVTQNLERIENHLKEVMTYKSRKTILERLNICDCLDKTVYQAQEPSYLGGSPYLA